MITGRPDPAAPILPILPTTPARMTHDYISHGTTGLFTAHDMTSGSAIAQHYRKPPRVPPVNLVKRWFGELTNRKLRRSTHRSVAELEADICK